MSGTSITVTKRQKGPTLNLTFFVTSLCSVTKDSEEFVINDSAKVRFRFNLTRSDKLCEIYISFKKHGLSETSPVRINVICERPKYLKQFTCSENWLEWVFLGTQEGFEVYDSNNYTRGISYVIDISIKVYHQEIEKYLKLYEDSEFTDFQLTTAEGAVAVHKACLAACSDYFKKLCAGQWKEAEEGSVYIKDVSKKNIQDLKDFVYLGTLPDDGLLPLIVLAKRFLIEDLVEACAKKLAETVLPENYYSLHEHACINNLPELTCAMAELTTDTVVYNAYQLKMNKRHCLNKSEN